ncbi:flocculation protein FLO11-like [Humulus lupulus]|uniref:flocculation protein FLO11-like n=1 Tax=Humulus lupulus TaxID=3486 RepID=UPI002B40A00A|nr:flocculation protein FLO11-like [Humulus lupulus]
MKQRANRRRSRLRSSSVPDVPVSPSPEVAVSSSVDASVPSAVATSPSRVVSPALDSSVAIVSVLPTVAESSPSSSLPEVVTGSVPTVSSSGKVLHARPPSSVGKSPKCITRSSTESASSPVPSSPLPTPTTPSIPSLKSSVKPSLTKTPKARSASKPAPPPQLAPPPNPAPKPAPPPQPKPAPQPQSTPTPQPKPQPSPTPKPQVPVRSKGKAKMHESSPLPKPPASKRKPKVTPVAPSPKKSKLITSSKDSVFVDPSSIQYFVDATKASHYQRWFASRQWVNTVSKLVSPHPILIREFYANLDKSIVDGKNEDFLTAFVRGSRIKFAPSTISRALKIPKVLKPAYNKSYRPDQSTMGHVLTGQHDYVWGNHEIPVTKLTPFYRILHRVALYNWFPNSHLSSITLEIGKFLYAVGTSVSIDLATLIFDRIVDVASSTGTRNKLPFPSLIQQIIQSAKPSLTFHDFQVPNPILSKGFLATLKRKVSSTAPSSS